MYAIRSYYVSGALATMVLKKNHEREHFSEVLVEGDRVTGFGGFPDPPVKEGPDPSMFTGIHILEPEVFDYIPRGVYSDIVPTFYAPAVREGKHIAAHFTEARWFELSTIPRYLVITSYSIHYTKLYDSDRSSRNSLWVSKIFTRSYNFV